MALGTMFGGWRIVKTMGQKITKLKPVDGFCAETGGAITLFLATWLGVPVSTTHTITGAIVGVGSVQQVRRGALGRGRQHRLGLDPHHSLLRVHRRGCLVPGPAVSLAVSLRIRCFPICIRSTLCSHPCRSARARQALLRFASRANLINGCA